uniref:Uncharacterized protein n=1 Tax=Glossina austeni TaxID=7395 RepID=A0A1A9UD30_GLOAU
MEFNLRTTWLYVDRADTAVHLGVCVKTNLTCGKNYVNSATTKTYAKLLTQHQTHNITLLDISFARYCKIDCKEMTHGEQQGIMIKKSPLYPHDFPKKWIMREMTFENVARRDLSTMKFNLCMKFQIK